MLTQEHKLALLDLARDAVTCAVRDGKLPPTLRDDGIFAQRCGVFVTLYAAQRLRGCIGVVESEEPLGHTIVRCAASAALCDPRFSPVCEPELAALQIELSLLSTPIPTHPEAIEIGRHGIIVRPATHQERPPGSLPYNSGWETGAPRRDPSARVPSHHAQGVLLPQVAIEHNFNLEQFLAAACRKADVSADAWRHAERRSGAAEGLDSSESGVRGVASLRDLRGIQLLAFTTEVFTDAAVRLHSTTG